MTNKCNCHGNQTHYYDSDLAKLKMTSDAQLQTKSSDTVISFILFCRFYFFADETWVPYLWFAQSYVITPNSLHCCCLSVCFPPRQDLIAIRVCFAG